MRLIPALFAPFLLALASCGGGGSSSQPTTPPPAPPVTAACVQANYTGTPELALLAGNMGAKRITGDGPLQYALIDEVVALALDGQGRLYMLENDSGLWDRHYVRRLQDGAILTIAGTSADRAPYLDGTGKAAGIPGFYGAAVGSNGNLFFSDPDNGTIRQVTPAGVVTTYAGKAGENSQIDGSLATARFQSPGPLAADKLGNLYVGDRGTLRKISAAGQVTTLAGASGELLVRNGAAADARFAGIRALAVEASGAAIYISDDNALRRLAGGIVTTVAGQAGSSSFDVLVDGQGAAARFGGANGLALDQDGTIYVADDRAVRRVSPAGLVTTLAGSSAYGYHDGQGAAAAFEGASAIVIDAQSNLWVNDRQNGVLRRVTKTGEVSTAAGVRVVTGNADGTGAAATFGTPSGIYAECSGQFLVADHGIRRVSPAGVVTTVAANDQEGRQVLGMDPAGNLLANVATGDVQGFFRFTATGSTLLLPRVVRAITFDKQGVLYFATQFQVGKLTPEGTVTILAGHDQTPQFYVTWQDGTGDDAYFAGLAGIAVDKDGTVFVSEGNFFSRSATFTSGAIRKITPNGVVTTVAGKIAEPGYSDGPGVAARFNDPHGLAFDAAGSLYIADTGNNAIRKLAPDGTVNSVLGKPDDGGYVPYRTGQMPRTGAFVPGPLATASVLAPRALAINGNTMAITAQQGVLLLRGLP